MSSRLRLIRAASWVIGTVPTGFGQGRLALAVYRRAIAGRSLGEVKARFRGGTQLRFDLSDRIQAIAFLTRDYEPKLLRFLERRLRGGSGVFLDVGAHVGLVSLSVAARCKKGGITVHAFEPDPANAASLNANLQLNPDLDVTFTQAAVGARAGRAVLQRSFPSRNLSKIVGGGGVAGNEQDTVDVPVVTLDDYLSERGIDHVAALKLDVEGFEPAVLEGAQSYLSQGRIDCVVCEINESCLEANGWSAEMLYDAFAGHNYAPSRVPVLGLRRIFPRRERGAYEDVVFARQR